MIPLLRAQLALPPSANHRYGQNSSRRYKLPRVRQYEQDCLLLLTQAWQDAARIDAARSANSPIRVDVRAYLKPQLLMTSRGGDVDNMLKSTLDIVMKMYLGIDDAKVIDLYVSKRPTTSVVSMVIEVNDMEELPHDEQSI